MRVRRSIGERGQAAPFAAAAAALAVVLTVAVGRLAGDLVDAARARTAADASALAAVHGGRAAADALAARHDASVDRVVTVGSRRRRDGARRPRGGDGPGHRR